MADKTDFQLNNNSIFLDKNFTLGVATSSYQIEGAYDVDDKLPSIWDVFSKIPGRVKNGDTGDVACDHYHRYAEDSALIAELGFDAYRFSIAWARVLHKDGTINHKGMDFYKRMLDSLHKHDIKAFATLYHWDLPQHIQERGGWLNRETSYLFADYAQKVMAHLGDKFATVVTLNEPWVSAHIGHTFGFHAPGLKSEKAGLCAAHHLLLGHGLGIQAIHAENPTIPAGIVLNMTPNYPHNKSNDDKISALVADEFNNDWFIQPILQKTYPYWYSKLNADIMPQILEGDMEIIGQKIDILGINYYTRGVITAKGENGTETVYVDDAEHTDFDWEVYPQGLTDLLVGLNKRYDLPPIYITENGCAYEAKDGTLNDQPRLNYYEKHLNALDDAAKAGVNIKGYFAWSLMDNFEWAAGYEMRFGIVHVDFESQKRTPKQSALAFKALNQQRR
ncbi:MAG: GH1 family beta-glucosidase [Alphaproteobacteria bacterium]